MEFIVPQCWQDLELVEKAGIDRVILYGPPGTGKTHAALHRGSSWVERLICTEDLTAGEVTGAWIPVGDGKWSWQDGPALRAWRRGGRLVVDEVDRASGDVLSLLLAMTDTDGSAEWHHPTTGEVVRPARGFNVVMTTNLEFLAELPDALIDRFPVAIRIDQPHPSGVLHLSPDLRAAAMSGSLPEAPRRVSLRMFTAFDRLRSTMDARQAAQILMGETNAESFLDSLKISTVGL
jgi:hypothetical protein